MKKLLGVAVVALLVVGVVKIVHSQSAEGRARAACANLAKQCGSLAELGGEKITSGDIDECASDFASDGKKALGDQFAPMVECMADADSCGEAIGCIGGAAANEIDKQLDGMGKGFEKMSKNKH